jgi:hypothetical protein
LLLITQHVERTGNHAPLPDTAGQRQLRGLGWLHLIICLLVIFALWYLETRPLMRPE